MRFLVILPFVAGLMSAAPAFAQDRAVGNVDVRATEAPIDQSKMQKPMAAPSGGASSAVPNGVPASKNTATGGPAGGKTTQ